MFELVKNKKQYSIIYHNKTYNNKQVFTVNIAAIYNKFNDVFDIVNFILDSNSELQQIYDDLLSLIFNKSVSSNQKFPFILEKTPLIIKHIDTFIDEHNLLDGINVVEDSSYSLNINAAETKLIYKASIRTRFFIPVYLTNEYSLSDLQMKEIHTIICQELLTAGIIDKLFRIIDSMILQTSPERKGKRLWDMLSASQGYASDTHNLELINSLFYKALPSLKLPFLDTTDEIINPIAYLISVAKNELQWLLQTSFSYICIPSSLNLINNIPTPKSHIIEQEVFYRTVTKNIFSYIAKNYSNFSDIYHYNVYPILYNISQPFIIRVFSLPIKYFYTTPHLMNLFVYDCINKVDPQKETLLTMLRSGVVFDKQKTRSDYPTLPNTLMKSLYKTVMNKKFDKYISDKTQNTIRKLFTKSILNLYRYKYIDPRNGSTYNIKWKNFIEDEYVDYIYNLVTTKYDDIINEKKEELKTLIR